MFSQQKKFYQKKMFYAVLAVCVFSFGLWMNHSVKLEDSRIAMKNEATDSQQVKQSTEYEKDKAVKIDNLVDDSEREQDKQDQRKKDAAAAQNADSSVPEMTAEPPYYFIQAQDGLVKIFHYDEDGQGKLMRTTSISFSLLSDIDQQLLEDGIVRHTEEEMQEFLQDYES